GEAYEVDLACKIGIVQKRLGRVRNCRRDLRARKERLPVEKRNRATQQSLRLEQYFVTVEAEQIVQVKGGLRALGNVAIGPPGGQIPVSPRGVRADLIKKDFDARRRQVSVLALRWPDG